MCMITFKVESDFFNIKDTLDCGQIFRYKPKDKGYFVYSLDKCAYVYQDNDFVSISVNEEDYQYFYNYFDLDNDYLKIYQNALNENVEILTKSAISGKGVRILNQDKTEILFSFIVSQNNNIPRIKSIIEKLCTSLGETKNFMGEEYYAFPKIESLAKQDLAFFYSVGLGYRAPYIKRLAEDLLNGFNLNELEKLDTKSLKKALTSIYGVGPKVADCVSLFGFHKTDSFPVDTWIEKVYLEDFKGTLKDRNKIADYFVKKFKNNSGYFQQYLFYYKRSKE